MELKILGSICFLEAVGTVGKHYGISFGSRNLPGRNKFADSIYSLSGNGKKHIRKYVRSVSVKFGSRIESVRNVDTFFKKGCLKNS